ncbi:MAG: hypothetical protein NVS9B14_20240 [Candidatus Acidiferrum sp.]
MDQPQGLEAAIGRVSALARLGGNGIRDVVFLATSASSIAAEIVLTCALPTRGVRFHLLHRIDALAIRELEKQLDFRFTLFVVSSKTGKNLEMHASRNGLPI